LIHFVCAEKNDEGDARFFTLRSSGAFDDANDDGSDRRATLFVARLRVFLGRGGQISPNCEVISSIIACCCCMAVSIAVVLLLLSMRNDECDDGGLSRLTIDIDIEAHESGGGVDRHGERGDAGRLCSRAHVDRVRSMVSRRMRLGEADDDGV
jgi:hypothetical protein